MNNLLTEEITIKNESATTVPNTETVNEQPPKQQQEQKSKRNYLHRKKVIRKTPEERIKLRQYARNLTKANRRKLTTCPKCDKPGYAKYRVRSENDKLVLEYYHSNEPPIGFKKVTDDGLHRPGYLAPIVRECWIGNVLSESDFMSMIDRGSSSSRIEQQQQQQIKPQPQTDMNTSIESAKEFVKSVQPKFSQHDKNIVCLRLWAKPELVKKIDEKCGVMSRSNFIVEILERVLN